MYGLPGFCKQSSLCFLVAGGGGNDNADLVAMLNDFNMDRFGIQLYSLEQDKNGETAIMGQLDFGTRRPEFGRNSSIPGDPAF